MKKKHKRSVIAIPRVRAWMLGYYAAKVEQNQLLSDIPLSDLSFEYLLSLGKRAELDTRKLISPKMYKHVDNLIERVEK